jgi:hypothetical protein
MKTIFTTAFLLFIQTFVFAQAPQGIPYQAVMRNADGSVMASSAVNLIFVIHDGAATGAIVYQESHSLNSNAQGLVSCVVGNGVVSQGNFVNINWGGGAKFLQVMMGSIDLGTQQMLSVPYALYSETTNVSVSVTGDTLTIGGNSVIVPGVSNGGSFELTIGSNYQGGRIAYIFQPWDIGYVHNEVHGIISAIEDLSGGYGCYGSTVLGADLSGIGQGSSNTDDLVSAGCNGIALACSNYSYDGYDDWFLPSVNELGILYNNRLILGGFSENGYWSSTDSVAYSVLIYFFDSGMPLSIQKDNVYFPARPIRYF